MIKYLVLLFNLIGLLVYQVFMQSTVTVTQTAPPNATPGSTFTVQVTITKGSLTGFAKYQADLPQGCTATATAKGGATVLSSGNAIKFIWSSIPGDNVINISYAVSVDPSAPAGAQNISGKFQYVIDNQKQSSDANPLSVTIGGGATASNTTPPPASGGDTSHAAGSSTTASTTPPSGGNSTSVNPPSGGNTNSTTPPSGGDNNTSGGNTTTTSTTPPSGGDNNTSGGNTTTTSTTPPSGGSQSTGGGNGVSAPPAPALMGVSATRSLSSGSVAPGGTIVVSVTVHKGTQSGFAKLEEIIPAGFTVTEGDKKTASFTLVDNKMKYVWLSLPADSVFTVTYNLVAGSNVSGDQQVAGTFSFVADGGPQHYPINATTFSVSGSGAITSTQGGNNSSSSGNTSSGNNSSSNTSGGNNSGGNTSGGSTNSGGSTTTAAGGNTSTIPNASGAAVIYYVQVMAFQNPARSVSFVKNYYKITESIDLRDEGGLHKFTTRAKFTDYKGAHDHRDELKRNNGVSDAFVVAYNNGSRITVQNALMITQQQWYQ